MLDGIRQQVANRVGTWMAQQLGPTLLLRSLEQRLIAPTMRLEALREMTQVKNFISTPRYSAWSICCGCPSTC